MCRGKHDLMLFHGFTGVNATGNSFCFISRMKRPLIILIPTLWLAACSSMKIDTEKAPGADLSQYKTYSWSYPSVPAGPAGTSGKKTPEQVLLDQEVESSANRQLAQKGLVEGPQGSSDLIVRYATKTKTSNEYGTDDYGANYNGDYGYWAWDGPNLYPIREGTLCMILIDRKTSKVVWRGRASDVINKSGESKKQINEAVKGLFKKYPST
jgi:hypothetical protein